MAEVEDVAGTVGGVGEDFGDAGLEDGFGREEGDGVEIALDRGGVAEGVPGAVERCAPVEAEDVGAGFLHGGEERGSVHAEVDDGDAEGADALDEFCGGGEAVLAVVGGGERPGPGIEDLDDVGAGFDLLLGEGGEDGDEFLHQERPDERVIGG